MSTMLLRRLRRIFRLRESDKHFLLALLVVTGVVFFWRGAWEIMDITPIIENPFVSLFIGMLIMTLSGVIYREFLPEEEPFVHALEEIERVFAWPRAKRTRYLIRYYDDIAKRMFELRHVDIENVEFGNLVLERAGREVFIPMQRVRELVHEGKVVWKKE